MEAILHLRKTKGKVSIEGLATLSSELENQGFETEFVTPAPHISPNLRTALVTIIGSNDILSLYNSLTNLGYSILESRLIPSYKLKNPSEETRMSAE